MKTKSQTISGYGGRDTQTTQTTQTTHSHTTYGADVVSSSSWHEMNLSFAGCGFLGLYHVGVASCFREYAPNYFTHKICGASAGALAALALVAQLPLGESTSEILQVAIKARHRALGPFHPAFDVNQIIYDGLKKTLPEDVHIIATGRLFISVTRVSDGKNVLINQFNSKEDVIRAIQCSCFIPFWSGLVPPKFHGVAYMDGGFSNNLPILDEHTITVSPFSGECDICPVDDTCNLLQMNLVNTSISISPANIYRITRILFPAHPEVLSQMCQQGFDDALRYLQRNNKISCTRCLAFQTTLTVDDCVDIEVDGNTSDSGCDQSFVDDEHSDNCIDCEYRRQLAVLDSLPDAVVQAIQEACDQVNKGVINWIFRHRPMKLLSILSIPYLLPIDITIVLFCKAWQRLPSIKKELKSSLLNLLSFLRSLVVKMESKRHQYSAKFSCQLAVTEFDYSNENSANSTAVHSRKVSTVSAPKRKHTYTGVEKAHSFAGRRNMPLDSLKSMAKVRPGMQRKSYAGSEYCLSAKSNNNNNNNNNNNYNGGDCGGSNVDRRRSMIEMTNVQKPERVITKLNFGFSFDLKNKSKSADLDFVAEMMDSEPTRSEQVMDAFKNLEAMDQANAIDIANKALDWERECLSKYHQFGQQDTDIDKMIEMTKKHEALMAFYYMDDDKSVKVTEIFNVSDNTPTGKQTKRSHCSHAYDQNTKPINADTEDGLPEPQLNTDTVDVDPQTQKHQLID